MCALKIKTHNGGLFSDLIKAFDSVDYDVLQSNGICMELKQGWTLV
jgi:hypothetical protein